MKFLLKTTAYRYSREEADKLLKYGFTFSELSTTGTSPKNKSDVLIINGKPSIEFNSLDELIAFQRSIGNSIIIDGDEIEIYNDWRE